MPFMISTSRQGLMRGVLWHLIGPTISDSLGCKLAACGQTVRIIWSFRVSRGYFISLESGASAAYMKSAISPSNIR